jgi:hypothetical protein
MIASVSAAWPEAMLSAAIPSSAATFLEHVGGGIHDAGRCCRIPRREGVAWSGHQSREVVW